MQPKAFFYSSGNELIWKRLLKRISSLPVHYMLYTMPLRFLRVLGVLAWADARADIEVRTDVRSSELKYRNVPKFSDRQVWANSADPDQTAPPRGA